VEVIGLRASKNKTKERYIRLKTEKFCRAKNMPKQYIEKLLRLQLKE